MGNWKTPGSGSSLSGAVLTQQEGTPRWSRRHFLTASAMAGTGVLVGPELAGAARSSANPQLRGGDVPIEDLPREQTLILQNPEPGLNNPGWFNIWVEAGGGWSTGLQQLMMDTLWFIDPNAGNRRRDPQLAGDRPTRVQRGLHRNDGESARRHLLERR